MAQEASEMAEFEGPKPGSFCWTEIASTDAEKCKAFYSNVFGWSFKDSKATEGAFTYNEFTCGSEGYPSGGLYTISHEICGAGELPPPHFLTYVAVENVDENAKRAEELGGTIIKEPTDIPNTGRFALIQDPSGAMFATFTMKS